MQYNSHATNQDIVSEINSLCDSDATSYPIAAKTRRVNAGLEEIIAEIINADGTWQYDDTNHTDLPVGTGTLVEAQESYSFTSEYLQVEQVKIKDVNGNWFPIKPFDPRDIELSGISVEEYFSATGRPEVYDILGDTIRLYPAPTSTAVTLASGLKVHFKRTADLFTTTDTVQEPGIPSPYHILLAYYASIPYCATYKKDRVAWLEKKWQEGVASIIKFYGRREKDRRKVMTMAPISFR